MGIISRQMGTALSLNSKEMVPVSVFSFLLRLKTSFVNKWAVTSDEFKPSWLEPQLKLKDF